MTRKREAVCHCASVEAGAAIAHVDARQVCAYDGAAMLGDGCASWRIERPAAEAWPRLRSRSMLPNDTHRAVDRAAALVEHERSAARFRRVAATAERSDLSHGRIARRLGNRDAAVRCKAGTRGRHDRDDDCGLWVPASRGDAPVTAAVRDSRRIVLRASAAPLPSAASLASAMSRRIGAMPQLVQATILFLRHVFHRFARSRRRPPRGSRPRRSRHRSRRPARPCP